MQVRVAVRTSIQVINDNKTKKEVHVDPWAERGIWTHTEITGCFEGPASLANTWAASQRCEIKEGQGLDRGCWRVGHACPSLPSLCTRHLMLWVSVFCPLPSSTVPLQPFCPMRGTAWLYPLSSRETKEVTLEKEQGRIEIVGSMKKGRKSRLQKGALCHCRGELESSLSFFWPVVTSSAF